MIFSPFGGLFIGHGFACEMKRWAYGDLGCYRILGGRMDLVRFVVLLVWFFSSLARAETPPAGGSSGGGGGAGQGFYFVIGSSPKFSTAAAVCQWYIQNHAGPTNVVLGLVDEGGGDCYVGDDNTPYPPGFRFGFAEKRLCPAGEMFSDGQCGPPPDCPPDTVATQSGQCCPKAGTVEGTSGNSVESSSSTPSGSVCLGGCAWKGGGVVPKVCGNGKCYTFGPFTSMGAGCTGEGSGGELPDAQPSPGEDAQCVKRGQCPGTVNGQKVCVPCGDKSQEDETTEETTEEDSEGNEQTTSKKTTQKVECSGGSCKVTKTTQTTKNGVTTTDEGVTVEPQVSYCAKNPSAAVCREEEEKSSWGGACSGGFQCDGDAVQCAQAQASWKLACDMAGDESDPSVQVGRSAVTAGDRPGDHPGNSPETLQFSAAIDSSNPYGSSCPPDFTLDALGTSVVVPLSSACDTFKWMGYVAVAFATLAAARIVFGGVKG